MSETEWFEVTLKIKGRSTSAKQAERDAMRRISEMCGLPLSYIKVVAVEKTQAP